MDSQNSVTQIIEAASQMFIVHGYEETSISEICKSCNISKGKLYYYFSDKEDLFTACCAHAYSLVNEIFNLFVFDPETTFKNNLLNFFSVIKRFSANMNFCFISSTPFILRSNLP